MKHIKNFNNFEDSVNEEFFQKLGALLSSAKGASRYTVVQSVCKTQN